MNRRLSRLLAASMLTAIALALPGTAQAVEPNHQACLGRDVSGYAQAGGGLHFLPDLVQAMQPFGQAIQAHLAGEVPDEVIPNSCND